MALAPPSTLVRLRSSLDVSRASVVSSLAHHQHALKESLAADVKGALDPQSTFLKGWRQLLLAATVYELFLLPFVVTFEPHATVSESPEILVFYVCEILFCGDFAVKLNTGFYEDGSVHRDTRRAMLKYVKSANFVVEVVAILPFSLMYHPNKASNMYLEFHKLLRLKRMPEYLSNLDDVYARHFEMLRILKTVGGTLFLSHGIACIRFWFGYDDDHNNHRLASRPKYAGNRLSVRTTYLQSLFWGFGMLTGFYEGELPHEIPEFVFNIAITMCGFCVFTYLCVMFFMLSKCESGHIEVAEARINQLKHIMAFHQVPERLQAQTVDYLKWYSTDAESNDREALKLVCPSIAKDLQVELLKDTVARIPAFAGCSPEFIRALTNALDVMFLPAHCTVFRAGDEGDAMYIIHSGVLDVILDNFKVRELRKGDFVGEMSLFSDRSRSATVVTTTYSMLYKLSRFHTERVLEGYPQFVPVIRQSVTELIAKADHHASANESKSQPLKQTKQRRGSALSSQVLRIMKTEVKKSMTNFTKKSAVVPQSTITRGDGHEIQKGESSDESPTETMVNRLRRAVSVRPRVNADSVRFVYDQYTRLHPSSPAPRTGLARLLLENTVDADSRFRLWWLLLLQGVLIYDVILVPLETAFPAVDLRVWYIIALNIVTDFILLGDIYLNFNLSYMVNSEKIVDPAKSAERYLKHEFVFDVLFAFPFWAFGGAIGIGGLGLPRLLRLWRLPGHLKEIEKLHHINSKRKLLQLGLLLLMLCHVVACLYFCTTFMEGFSEDEDAWIPTHDVQLVRAKNGSGFFDAHSRFVSTVSSELAMIASLQYVRALYYATNVLTGLGKTVEPSSDSQYAIAVVLMFSGFIITAVVVDNVQKRFTASAFEQKELFAVRTRIQLFLRRQNAPLGIHHRVNSYLDYWWSAHRGAHLQDLLAELPVAYRREVLRSICGPALQSLALLAGVRPVLSQLETAFVDCVQFVLYGQGEFVYHQGDNAHRLHFLLQGSVHLKKNHIVFRKVPLGGFFGTRALESDDKATRYSEDAVAASGCVLIRVSRLDLGKLCEVFANITTSLLQLERRLLDNKLARFTSDAVSAHTQHSEEPAPRWKSALLDPLEPDSVGAVAWETWLFCAMTIQWVTALIHVSFGVDPQHFVLVDCITVVLECSFFIDIYVRCRMGYHEFGNKIMEVRRIRQRYMRSRSFVVDIIAVIPLFAVNWVLKGERYEILNINKLVRLLKVPGQFMQLEQRYLKWTTELRVLKLVYYTLLATHLSGCIYHDFASHLSTANLLDPSLSDRHTAFGWNHWLLGESLAHTDKSLRYFSSIFWSFGLMSASYQGELPKTTPQCLFSVMTMMTGFFLFAYVIGNFSDVIEMMDSDSREFNARLGSVRHLLTHFTLPASVSTKMKGYFFFRRYHTITQEHLIESCLPPSLVTDIRLLNLQRMIDKVSFMRGMEPAITRMLVAQFGQVLVVKEEFVYRFGEEGSDMFFVFTGILAVLSQQTAKKLDMQLSRSRRPTAWANASTSGADGEIDQKTFRNASQLTSGDFFGENALFSDTPRNSFVVARTSCILYSLSRHSLSVVFDLYPDWKKQVMQSVKVHQKQHRIHGFATETIHDAGSSLSGRDDDDCNNDLASHQRNRLAAQEGSRGLANIRASLKRGVEAQSQVHILWLRTIVFCTVFNAVLAPYRISIDSLERWTGVCVLVRILDIFSDVAFVADIWFNCILRESALSVELYEQTILETYKRERLFWDVISAVPIDYVLSIFAMDATIWIRLLRCVKVANLKSYLNEIDRRSVSYEVARFSTITLLCAIYIFWCACAYLALAVFGGFGSEWAAWLPSKQLEYDDNNNPDARTTTLRLLRGLAYSSTAFAKKARTYYPETVGHLVFSITMSFGGVLVMAFMIGEIASLYISFIRNQVDFRKNVITLELFLSRYRVSPPLRHRVHAYLSTLWSTHSGVNYESVLADLPRSMRTEAIRHIGEEPLQSFAEKVFGPLLRGDSKTMQALLRSIARELKFEGYPRGKLVIAEGVINDSMYFVIHGHLVMTSSRGILQCDNVRFRKGQWFGEKGIVTVSVSPFSVRALKACDLFSLTSDALMRVLQSYDFLWLAFSAASEVVTELRAIRSDRKVLTTDAAKWKAVVKQVLTKRRDDWVGSRPPRGAGSTSTVGSSSKAATQWSALLVDMLDSDSKSTGIGVLDPILQLLTANGVTYDRPTERQARESRVYSAGSTSGRMRFRDMVLKLSKSEAKSAKSTHSTKVHSMKEAADQVEQFVPEE